MKKISSILMISMLAVAVLFTSCNKDDDDDDKRPVLTFNSADGYTTSNKTVTVGEEITVGWVATANTSTSKKLSHFKAYIAATGMENQPLEDIELNDASYITQGYVISAPFAGIFDIKAEVTDKAGETRSVFITITVVEDEPEETPLSAATPFTWHRVGNASGTGLAQFGLEWKNNTGSHITITPATGTKLVELAETDWTTITTQEELAAIVDAATGISKWEVIPTKVTFNYVIATKTAEGKYFLINPTERTINPNDGGDRTVTGQYKE